MSGSQAPAAQLDARRRRIVFRSRHRGMLEMDLIMGRFIDAEIANLSDSELDDVEALLDAPDPDVFAWATGEAEPPARYDTPVFRKIVAFHSHVGPIHN
ncbi:succinate dehydrogenase assembly factor 2 [Methylocapsa polymorpha]|uniref:FAD assembly factor SdhE n=1 Tax=Methylocapsa polymorpha TaxID=3080828 RepID=A0ABZ0HZA8_9HYPH|nr:succinate dehydrogenase assembly factor 2 [Methylocapsa sp. RX1]